MLRSRVLTSTLVSVFHTTKRTFFYRKEKGFKREWLANIHDFLDTERDLQSRLIEKKWKALVEDQKYLDERHKYLGPDLATAHFITARGGSIKFVGNDNWFYTEKNKYTHELPNEFTAGWFVEAIDASGMPIMYDSMANLVHLDQLRSLNLSCCDYVDDFCLFVLHRFQKTLVHLNLSKCPLITGAGLESLHHLPNLRKLELYGMIGVEEPELHAIMIEEALPYCIVEGIDYTDTKKLTQMKNNHLLEDAEEDSDFMTINPAKMITASKQIAAQSSDRS